MAVYRHIPLCGSWARFLLQCQFLSLSVFFSQVSPWDKREEATEKKLGFAGNNSDHIALLKAYKVQSALALVLTGNKKIWSKYLYGYDVFD